MGHPGAGAGRRLTAHRIHTRRCSGRRDAHLRVLRTTAARPIARGRTACTPRWRTLHPPECRSPPSPRRRRRKDWRRRGPRRSRQRLSPVSCRTEGAAPHLDRARAVCVGSADERRRHERPNGVSSHPPGAGGCFSQSRERDRACAQRWRRCCTSSAFIDGVNVRSICQFALTSSRLFQNPTPRPAR